MESRLCVVPVPTTGLPPTSPTTTRCGDRAAMSCGFFPSSVSQLFFVGPRCGSYPSPHASVKIESRVVHFASSHGRSGS